MLKINNNGCIMIVIEDAQSMFCHHDKIQEALKKISIKNGTILFDTLLHSGIGERRFITVEFRDGEIWGIYRYTTEVSAEHPIRKMTCDFLRKHEDMLKKSFLADRWKEAIIRGENV